MRVENGLINVQSATCGEQTQPLQSGGKTRFYIATRVNCAQGLSDGGGAGFKVRGAFLLEGSYLANLPAGER